MMLLLSVSLLIPVQMADKMMVGEAIRDSENLELEKVSKTGKYVLAL